MGSRPWASLPLETCRASRLNIFYFVCYIQLTVELDRSSPHTLDKHSAHSASFSKHFAKAIDQESVCSEGRSGTDVPPVYNRLKWRTEENDFLKERLDSERKRFKKPWFCLITRPAQSTALMCTYSGHAGRASACAFSPDGRRIVSASWDQTLKLWTRRTGQEISILEGHTDSRCRPVPTALTDAELSLASWHTLNSGTWKPPGDLHTLRVILIQ